MSVPWNFNIMRWVLRYALLLSLVGCSQQELASSFQHASGLPFPHIFFAFDSDAIRASEALKIEQNSAWMAINAATVWVTGYTDAQGPDEYNRALGDRRARSVAAALIARGVAAERFRGFLSGGEEDHGGGHYDRRAEIEVQ